MILAMSKPRSIDALGITVMVVLCMSWAFQQITVKFALPDIGPLGQGTIRSAGASVLVGLYMIFRLGSQGWMRGLTAPGLLAGFLFGAEFMLLFVALVYTDAARAVMFLYTAPFVVALGGHLFLPGERLDLKSVIGIVLAFAGVAVALDPAASTDSDAWIGDLMALAAGIMWGLTTLVIKGSKLRYCPASQVLFYQVAVSAVMFFAGAMLTGDSPFVPMGPLAIASVLYQAVWVASITFGIWFVLIARYSPTSLSVVTFITPLFGAAFGYLFLGEMLGVEHIFAVVAVAIGILLVSLPKTPRPAAIGPEIDKNR